MAKDTNILITCTDMKQQIAKIWKKKRNAD